MSNERMNVIVAVKSKDGTKTFWRTIGSAWPRDVARIFRGAVRHAGGARPLIVAKDSIAPAFCIDALRLDPAPGRTR